MSEPITNPQAVKFVREQARVVADAFLAALRTGDVFAQNVANPELDYLSLIPNDDTVIDDGASVDGRPIVLGRHIHALVDVCNRIRAFADATSESGTPNAVRNALGAVAVNGRSLI